MKNKTRPVWREQSPFDTPWPKVTKGKAGLKKLLDNKDKIDSEDIFNLLKDSSYPPDNMLPDTGAGLSWERILSPMFITSELYGTRSSSIVLMERSGRISFWNGHLFQME